MFTALALLTSVAASATPPAKLPVVKSSACTALVSLSDFSEKTTNRIRKLLTQRGYSIDDSAYIDPATGSEVYPNGQTNFVFLMDYNPEFGVLTGELLDMHAGEDLPFDRVKLSDGLERHEIESMRFMRGFYARRITSMVPRCEKAGQ